MSNAKVIAIVNQKGGTVKTTTALNLGIGLVNQGKKVLLMDGMPNFSLFKNRTNVRITSLHFYMSCAIMKTSQTQKNKRF